MAYQFPAKSQRYDRYEARIKRLNRFLRPIRRHPVLTGLAVLAVTAGMVALLLCIGSFSGELKCGDFRYGDAPDCHLKAFLSKLHYEYAPEGDSVWTDTLPTQPGAYRIRAVSKNGFGQLRYSDSMTFNLLPRPVQVEIQSGSFVYGNTVTPKAEYEGLASGDSVNISYNIEENNGGNRTVSIKTIEIQNQSGKNVTACYEISATDGQWTQTQRPITLTVQDAEKTYDGIPWSAGTATLTKGSLASGDLLELHFDQIPADAGKYPLIAQCSIFNAQGQDVTSQYDIRMQAGELTVLPRPLWITTGSDTKIYDGLPLTKDGWTLVDGQVLPDHTLSATVTGTQTDVGESLNNIGVQIVDGQGKNMLSNYRLNLDPGILTVTPRAITVSSESAEKRYDGTPLVCHSYTADPDAFRFGKEDQTIHRANFTGTQTEVGSSANTFTVQIVDGQGNTTTDNYDITYSFGTLTVVANTGGTQGGSSQGGIGSGGTVEPLASLTLCAFSATKIYDGKGFDAFDLARYTLLSGSVPEGHRMEVDFSMDENPTTPGQYRNTITQCRIFDENGKDVTAQYAIHTIGGTLTILPRKITVTIGSATKVYDGTALTCGDYWISAGSLIAGHELALTVESTIEDVGQADNEATDVQILKGSRQVTDCYKITLIPGKLEITNP